MAVDEAQTLADFTLRFEGPAVADHRMDVRDLAPSLLALSELFREVNAELNPAEPPVALHLKAANPGSFVVDLSPVITAVGQAVTLFAADPATAAANLSTIVTSGRGIFAYMKARFLPGAREEEQQNGDIEVSFPDGMAATFPASVVRLTNNVTIQRRTREVVAPLARHGVERVVFERTDEVTASLDPEDLRAFVGGQDDGGVGAGVSSEREILLEVIAPTFKPDNKWRVTDGFRDHWVILADRTFIADVLARDETFAAGDQLRVIERTVQSRNPEGELKAEYIVTRVLEHIRPPRATALGDLSD